MNRKSFTLIELLIVILIMGMLAFLISGNFFTSLKKGRDAKRKADLEQITRALEVYYEDNRVYPLALTFGSSLCHPGGCPTKNYMLKLPNDPISGSYGYASDGTYFELNACLENSLQILPYISTPVAGFACTKQCRNTTDTGNVNCVWGVASSNALP